MKIIILGVILGIAIVVFALYYTGGPDGDKPATQKEEPVASAQTSPTPVEGEAEPEPETEEPGSEDWAEEDEEDAFEEEDTEDADVWAQVATEATPTGGPEADSVADLQATPALGAPIEGIPTDAEQAIGTDATRAPAAGQMPSFYAAEELEWKTLLREPLRRGLIADYPYSECFVASARANNLPIQLVLGLAAHLSSLDPKSTVNGKHGIMHVGWPEPARSMGVTRKSLLWDDSCLNIKLGCTLLGRFFTESKGEYVPALAAYRAQSAHVVLEDVTNADALFSSQLRERVEQLMRTPYVSKRKFVFRRFDRKANAERFIESIKNNAGVSLQLGQDFDKFIAYIVAKDELEMRRIADLIYQKSGISIEE